MIAMNTTAKRKEKVLLLIMLFSAFILRSYGIDWIVHNAYNPDEMHFIRAAGAMLEGRSLNPYRFSYPSDWPKLPLYLLLLVSAIASFFTELSLVKLLFISKYLSVLLSTLTVYVTYILARKAYNPRIGLLAAAFLSVTLLHVKDSHFYIHEIVYTFFATLALIYCIEIIRKGDFLSYMIAGLLAGFVAATAFTGYILIFAIISAHYLRGNEKGLAKAMKKTPFVLSIILVFLTPLLSNPYSLVTNTAQNGLIEALRLYPPLIPNFLGGVYRPQYIIPFEDTVPYIYHIKTLLFWGMGPLLEAVCLLGFIHALQRRRTEDILIYSWILAYFLVVGSLKLRFDRYMIPLLPFLCILGARLLAELREKSWKIAQALIIVTIISSLLYVAAYLNIYSSPGTRQLASDWIKENIKPGSTILVESDYTAYSPQIDANAYNIKVLDFYHLHYSGGFDESSLGWMSSDEKMSTQEKADYIREQLCGADYIVSGDRNYPGYLRLSERYPVESGYFTSLFSGELGFRLVKHYRVYPHLFGVSIDDAGSELSFRLMDHPEVLIYENINSDKKRFCD